MKFLMIGDVVGHPGRDILYKFLENLDIPVILISHRDTYFVKNAKILSLS